MPYRPGDEGKFLSRNLNCQGDGDGREGDATMRQNVPLRSSSRTGSVDDFRDRIVVGFSADQLPGLAHFAVEPVETRLPPRPTGPPPALPLRHPLADPSIASHA